MSKDLSIYYLITNASFVVQFVMFILLVASVISWTFIFYKRKEFKQVFEVTEEFEQEFWSGQDLAKLYSKVSESEFEAVGIEKIFIEGYKEFSRMQKKEAISPIIPVESAQRAMNIVMTRELDQLEDALPFLASVGSTSPYVGLFGTVWGIMNSFLALSDVKQATLASVAPGIAEALIATAIGLFAAIPAVVAYNYFSTRLDKIAGRYELFVDEFVVILQRQAHS